MSYRHVFAGDARRDWLKLDIAIQEAVLDELDRLCDAPPQPARSAQMVHDFTYDTPAARHVLFLYLSISHENQMMTVLSVGQFSHPAGTPPA